MRPYHTREDSLPFSYGPIRSISRNAISPLQQKEENRNNIGTELEYFSQLNAKRDGRNDSAEGHSGIMIKPEQHLKSPQLVRRTLRSSTNATTTNTFGNTSSFKHNNNHHSHNDTISLYFNSDKYDGKNSLNPNNTIYSAPQRSKTPTRDEFEELLRERREKVLNEYKYRAPQPPIRHYQQPSWSRSLTSLSHINDPSGSAHSTHRGQNNYDFEFYLNLNEFEGENSEQKQQQQPHEQSPNFNQDRQTITSTQNQLNNEFLYGYGNNVDENGSARFKSGQISADQRNYSQYVTSSNISNQQQQFSHQLDLNVGDSIVKKNSSEQFIEPTSYLRNEKKTDFSEVDSSLHMFTPSMQTLNGGYQQKQPANTRNAAQNSLIRPETPAFPVTPKLVLTAAAQLLTPNRDYSYERDGQNAKVENYMSETIYQVPDNKHSRFIVAESSSPNAEPQEVDAHLVKFAKDSSKFWYKSNLSREEAISLLLDAEPGTFVVRDSTTYKNAFGLVLRVAQMPPYNTSGKLDELVRHFLIEPTTRGVRLKGCANEPVFTSLSAFVYEHSINRLGLPCVLRIPDADLVTPLLTTPAQRQLITQGAACNVIYLYMCETESLTGEEAIRKTIRAMYGQLTMIEPTEVYFKVTQQGITLTDNSRKIFFRKHYSADLISFCAVDPDYHLWMPVDTVQSEDEKRQNQKNVSLTNGGKTIFAFVARRSPSSKYNQCHVFCDLDIHQPASAIVSYVNRTLPTENKINYIL